MSDKTIFQVPGSISKVGSMSRGLLQIQFDTMENVKGEHMTRLFELIDKPAWMTVNTHVIEAEDIVDLPPLKKTDNDKTPAQRLRSVLYLVWKRDNGGYKDFDNYYLYVMNWLIEYYKEKLI